MKKKSKLSATKKKTNLPAVNGVDNNPQKSIWYITNIKKRGGKTFETYTLSSEYDIRWLTHNLSKEVRCLKLSRRLLFYLMHYKIVSRSLENVNSAFNDRLDNFSFGKMERVMRRRDRKMVWITIPPSSLYKKYQKILHEAINFIHKDDYPWKLRNWLPDRFKKFRAISEEIIRNTNPKDAGSADLREEQKEWFWWGGDGIPCNPIVRVGGGAAPTPTIEGVFEYMLLAYNQMIDQLSKYRIMDKWLKNTHLHLHEFYLYGSGRYAKKEKVFPSIRERLESLDELVKPKSADLLMIEIALSQLKRLIEDDLLFTCVFYSYFYKQRIGRPPDLKRKALERAKPYVYYLKFFKKQIQPILWNGIEITSIYDLGVLLLNALAGEKIYSEELIDLTDKGYSARSGKLVGSKVLYDELGSFRKFWRSMVKQITVK